MSIIFLGSMPFGFFDYKLQNIMNKDQIIKNICRQNEELKQEVNYWKNQYHKIKRQYQALLESTQEVKSISFPKITEPVMSLSDISLFDSDSGGLTTTSPHKKVQNNNYFQATQALSSTKSSTKVQKNVQRKQSSDMFDFFAEKIREAPALDKNICQLIEGCFILQKNSSIDHFDPVKFVYPENKYTKLRNMFDIIYRFIFVNDKLVEIHDDEFDSRKNEILFGTPYEDFQFVFDNLSEKQGQKGRLNQFQKSTHILRKRYVYGIVRPQIVKIDKVVYETEIAYGFLSHVPFPNFFKDLNRIMQQEIKYRMLNMKKNEVKITQKLDIITQIIKEITSKSLENKLQVTRYPINLQLKANICGLRLVYSTKNNFISDQFSHIEGFINKFNLFKLVKTVHYVLAEQSTIIICKNRKRLNQLFQIIRSIIYPFNWIFPIVYFYSPFFEPFLTSPLPILIGMIQNSQIQEGYDCNSYSNQPIPQSQFVHIYADDEDKQDRNQIVGYKTSIEKCYKLLNKGKGTSTKQRTMSPLIQKSGQEMTTNKFFKYVKKLRNFIETGKLDEELNPFHIQFMQTQMVSYYKESQQDQKASNT